MTKQIPLPPESPKPPKKLGGKKIEFDNPEKHQTRKKLYQEIRQTLLDLRNSLPYANHRETIIQFTSVINPGSMGGDVTRLPYESQKPTARTASKMECVFALISYMIQGYWVFCTEFDTIKNVDCEKRVRNRLNELKQITKNGLKQYQVVGNVRDGFSLEKI